MEERGAPAEQENEPEKRPWRSKLWEWTGLGDKTLWDWLQLLIVPIVLAAAGFWFSDQQDARQREIEGKRATLERELGVQSAQDAALQAYLDQMSELVLEKDLRDSEEEGEVRTLARARTLTVLGRLGPDGKASVLQFLYESSLIRTDRSIVDLSNADLSGADLRLANLEDADLSNAVLSGAELDYADLDYANLTRADLSNAKLLNADLRHSLLFSADLSNADLSGARVPRERLETQNATLEGATMPNGSVYN